MMKFRVIICFLFLVVANLSAQTKNEKESRIQLSEFPEKGQTTINTIINDVKRIRHYKEIDGEHESFESKFKFKHHWYSVELSSAGLIEDIEVTVRESQLDINVKKNINTYLKSTFEKYDIIKIQEQYIPLNNTQDAAFISLLFKNRRSTNSNFEIIVAVKVSKDWELKEITFNMNGEFLNYRDIQQDSYEYIMY